MIVVQWGVSVLMQDPEIREPKPSGGPYSLQLDLPLPLAVTTERSGISCRDALSMLLADNLDFHGDDSSYASHNFHAFPAKFPPQLPRKFIEALTDRNDIVFDPMVGSGTTIVEALLTGRRGIGVDIDPLAMRVSKSKVTPVPLTEAMTVGYSVVREAQELLQCDEVTLQRELNNRFEATERKFIDYWFAPRTQLELMALVRQIQTLTDAGIREFLELTLSAIIITKSGGVSLARDLAHTRPHRVQDKTPRSAFEEYRRRLSRNLNSLKSLTLGGGRAEVVCSDARALSLRDSSVDLIVTSPPYASNAIDYMRAHKFSLVWLGHPLDQLSRLRQQYIGHDAILGVELVELPEFAGQIVNSLSHVDAKKAKVLHRYFSEMTLSLKEMARVLRSGKAAVLVVGTSSMRGVDTRTDICLAEIGKRAGFDLVGIAVRRLDRDRRMMPARRESSTATSQIEQRMHEEYVIGFIKPELK